MNSGESTWDKRLELAFAFGQFISWREVSTFMDRLSNLQEELVALANSQPTECLSKFEVFIAACLTKADEIDSYGDNLAVILDELFLGWIHCCDAIGMSGEEFIRKINHWVEVDDHGYCSNFEIKVIPALSQKFCDTLQKSLEKRKSDGDQSVDKIIKKLFASTKNISALIAYCKKYGDTDEDCLAIADSIYEGKQFELALKWVEKGLSFKGGIEQYKLKRLKREILTASGRESDAVADAWIDFEKSPSIYTFKTVLETSSMEGHKTLKDKALQIFNNAEFESSVVALHYLEEFDLLVFRLKAVGIKKLQEISYTDAIPMAETLSEKFPEESARLYIAHALRILEEGRAKAYYHAHDYLDTAKALLERIGKHDQWDQLVMEIRSKHRLKSSFMPGFNEIVSGKGAPREPTFIERIQSKLDGHDK